MNTHNIQFHDKMRKFPKIFVSLSCQKNFIGNQKRVRISHGKRAIGVRAIEVLLYPFETNDPYESMHHKHEFISITVCHAS